MSWVAAAIAGGGAITKAILANQQSQRNKGYIGQSARLAQQNLDYEQAGAREGSAENLVARGLAGGGDVNASPIATAMNKEGITQAEDTPRSIGAQSRSDEEAQMGLEQTDLADKVRNAYAENKVGLINEDIGAGIGAVGQTLGVKAAMAGMPGAAGAAAGGGSFGDAELIPGAEGAAGMAPALTPSRSAIQHAMLSGTSVDGVNPIDPLGHYTSSWFTGPSRVPAATTPGTLTAVPGQTSGQFNFGGSP